MKTASDVSEFKQGRTAIDSFTKKANSTSLTGETVMSVNGVARNVNKRVWYRGVEPSFRYGQYINVMGMQNSAEFTDFVAKAANIYVGNGEWCAVATIIVDGARGITDFTGWIFGSENARSAGRGPYCGQHPPLPRILEGHL